MGGATGNTASVLRKMGDLESAQRLFEESVARLRRALGPDHPDVIQTNGGMGMNLVGLGQSARAEATFREALARASANKSLTPLNYEWIAFQLTRLLIAERRFEEAEPLALRVLAIRDSVNGPADADTRESLEQLATLYDGWKKAEKAAEYRERVARATSDSGR